MNSRLVRSLLLAAMLLLVQVGALAHASTHLVKSPDGHTPPGTCAWCAAYSNADGPAADADILRLAPAEAIEPLAAPASVPTALPIRLAFRSHAPPRS